MADDKSMVLYAASYESVSAALAALDDIEQLHKDEVIGKYDAAVIDKEDGKPRIAKRMDRPGIRVIPEWFVAGPCLVRSSVRRLRSLPLTRRGSSRLASQRSKKRSTRHLRVPRKW